MKTVSINEKVNLQFVTPLAEYEKDITSLAKTKFKFRYEDVTPANSIAYAPGRPEVLITIENIDLWDCAFIKTFIRNLK